MIAALISYRVSVAREEFFSLPDNERATVLAALDGLGRIAAHPDGVVAGAQAEAASAGGARGASVPTLLRKFYAFRASNGDWRILVDRNRNKAAVPKLPADFVEFWRGLCEENQRKCRPAYRKLVALYRSGEQIPGYEFTGPRFHLPRGWGYSNLMRYKPTKYELTARRQGRAGSGPPVPPCLWAAGRLPE
jgi:hypothetical protein